MSTGDQFTKLHDKKLLGLSDLKGKFLEYLAQHVRDSLKVTYPDDGSYISVHGIAASGADEFDIDTGKDSTDGLGNVFNLTAALAENIQFENAAAVDYHVALKYQERPRGIRVNPRTSDSEYEYLEETVGEKADPDAVVDDTDGTMTVTVDSVCESGVSNAGRKCLVYLKAPADGVTQESVAVEEVAVIWSGGANKIETAGALGQSTISTTASDYEVILLGPLVRRNTDLSAVAGIFYIGTVQGAAGGPGNPPTVWDTSGQTLVAPYWGDIVCDTLTATSTTVGKTAVKGTGSVGPSNGAGVDGSKGGESTGGAGGSASTSAGGAGGAGHSGVGGVGGDGVATGGTGGAGLSGKGGAGSDGGATDGPGGYGVVAEAGGVGTGALFQGPLRLVPQSGAPGVAAVGDLYVTTAGVLKVCTNAAGPVWTTVGTQT